MGLSFFPALLFRCPAKPFDETHLTPGMAGLMDDTAFLEAVHLASPVLFEQCLKYRQNGIADPHRKQKLINSLTKYYNRMRSRPTPFGLFSGCAVLKWGEANNMTIRTDEWARHIRFDIDFLCSLTQRLMQVSAIRYHLRYRFNTSLYPLGGEWRYYEYQVEDHQRKYQISAVGASPLLTNLMHECAHASVKFPDLCRQVTEGEEVSPEEAVAYLDALIDSQLLISNLTFQCTGHDFLGQIIEVLQEVQDDAGSEEVDSYLTGLLQMQEQLREAKHAPCLPGALEKISDTITALSIPFQPNRLFQIDSTIGNGAQTVAHSLQGPLLEAVKALRVLCASPTESRWLSNIKEKLAAKYDAAPVSLPHLIDPDIGIIMDKSMEAIDLDGQQLNGYAADDTAGFPSGKLPENTPVKKLLTEKLLHAFKHDAYTVTITDEEIAALSAQLTLPPLPDTFPVMFSFIDDAAAGILIENAGGASGTSLIGRFGYTNEKIRELLQEIHAFEQGKNPSGILSSVVHLPEDRTGNILQHPAIRCFEIPYLAASSLSPCCQLSIPDLYVSLHHQQMKLYSRHHGKQVLPRIDSAHNYVYNTLPLYRLLGELQGQGKQTYLSFSWNIELPGICFYPRVQYKDIVLCPARWQLPSTAYKELLQPGDAEKKEAAFRQFCKKWQLPRFFVLSYADQALLVDQQDSATIQAFIAEIKQPSQIVLKEFLYAAGPPAIKDEHNRAYVHQIIAIVRNEATAPDHSSHAYYPPATTRNFSIGSEWLYFKLYCSHHYANEMLESIIAPASRALAATGLTDQWFFIRYEDPEEHLRIRFHLQDVKRINEVIGYMQQALQPAAQDQFIWKIQTDTYYREIERYGDAIMPQVERIFCIDSVYVLELLQYMAATPHHLPVLLIAIRDMDDLFRAFSFSLQEKTAFTVHYKDALNKEFNPDTEEKEIFNQYFRNNTSRINELLTGNACERQYPALFGLMQEKNHRISAIVQDILQNQPAAAPNIHDLPGNLLHMHFNRLFHTAQRRYEMIGYNVLSKFYRSSLARENH